MFFHKVNRIGQVTYIGRNQLKVYYKYGTGMSHEEWYPKSTLALLSRGDHFTNQQEVRAIRPEKDKCESEPEKAPERVPI